MDHRYKKFLAVAELGSFSAAAKQLRVTQPAITIAVASLERTFGTKLYIRHKTNIELTKQGKIVAQTAKKISQEIAKMHNILYKDTTTTKYQVGVIDSIAHLLNTSTDMLLMNNIEFMIDNSKRIINEIVANKIDIGVITGQSIKPSKEIVVHKLHNEEFVFVCAPYNTPPKAVYTINDWLAINQDSTSYRHFVKLFKKEHINVNPIFYSTSMELLKEMAIAGKGTALLPKHMVSRSLENGTLEAVKTKKLYRPIWAITRKEKNFNQITDLTLKLDYLLAQK